MLALRPSYDKKMLLAIGQHFRRALLTCAVCSVGMWFILCGGLFDSENLVLTTIIFPFASHY